MTSELRSCSRGEREFHYFKFGIFCENLQYVPLLHLPWCILKASQCAQWSKDSGQLSAVRLILAVQRQGPVARSGGAWRLLGSYGSQVSCRVPVVWHLRILSWIFRCPFRAFPWVSHASGSELSNFRTNTRKQPNFQCSSMTCICAAVRILIAGLSPQYLPRLSVKGETLSLV